VVDGVERHAEPFADQLREACLVTLPAIHRAEHELDAATRADIDLGALARRAAGALDVIGDADAAELAALPRVRLARGEALVIGETERDIEAALVFAVVVGDADAVPIGEGV